MSLIWRFLLESYSAKSGYEYISNAWNVRVNSLEKSWTPNPFTIYANELHSNIFIRSDEHIRRRVSLKKVMAKCQE